MNWPSLESASSISLGTCAVLGPEEELPARAGTGERATDEGEGGGGPDGRGVVRERGEMLSEEREMPDVSEIEGLDLRLRRLPPPANAPPPDPALWASPFDLSAPSVLMW